MGYDTWQGRQTVRGRGQAQEARRSMGRNSHGTKRWRIAPDLVKGQKVSFFHEKTDRSGAQHCLTIASELTHS